jgi:hypothetical protein
VAVGVVVNITEMALVVVQVVEEALKEQTQVLLEVVLQVKVMVEQLHLMEAVVAEKALLVVDEVVAQDYPQFIIVQLTQKVVMVLRVMAVVLQEVDKVLQVVLEAMEQTIQELVVAVQVVVHQLVQVGVGLEGQPAVQALSCCELNFKIKGLNYGTFRSYR